MPLLPLARPLDEGLRRARSTFRVALVSMPFSSGFRPSIQIGLLKAIADRLGFSVDNYHLGLDFAAQIGPSFYEWLADERRARVGDWLFSVAAFDGAAPDPSGELLERLNIGIDLPAGLRADYPTSGAVRRRLLEIRNHDVPIYLDRLVSSIDWGAYRVVGFTTTFEQNTASFALSRRLKHLGGHQGGATPVILFGGANFEGDMGVEFVRSVDWIDYAITGEADVAFPQLLRELHEDGDPKTVPGLIYRSDSGVEVTPLQPPFEALDESPIPSYDDYFERAERLGLLKRGARREVDLPFESARGCWWGAKHHCTFCGLNGTTMSYRSKSPNVVVQQLSAMASRYRSFKFTAVDNIMEPSYLDELFGVLEASGTDFSFFYEIKANLKRDQIRRLHRGGVRRIQPGIESLSSHVLSLMRKGVTAVQNVNTLRWCRYYGVGVGWNLIWGFPGETREDYTQQVALLREVNHLTPPLGGGRIWMERFSPVFTDRSDFPTRYIKPETSYEFIYPSHFNLEDAAYFFDYELNDTLPDEEFAETLEYLSSWQQAWSEAEPPSLVFHGAPGFIQIDDRRMGHDLGTYTFTGDLAALYAYASDRPRTALSTERDLGTAWPSDRVLEAVSEYVARGLMMQDGDWFLSLALPATPDR